MITEIENLKVKDESMFNLCKTKIQFYFLLFYIELPFP